MNKTAAVIAEYNPFHKGHEYQIQETRRLTGANYILVVMSGNFVQRGEPAIFEKSVRTRMALLCGADLVLELPVPYASASAEDFASGAVSLLQRLGVVDYLSFGSEEGSLIPLKEASEILSSESPAFSQALKEALRQGLTFPQARSLALERCGLSSAALKAALSSNNLLGIEYLKALSRFSSSIEPITIQRKGSGYHDSSLSEDPCHYASASAIRKTMMNSTSGFHVQERFFSHLPENLRSFYQENSFYPLFPDDCSLLLNYQLLTVLLKNEVLTEFTDFSEELARRLSAMASQPQTFTQRIQSLKTRQYTYTRVSRCLLHLMLNHKASHMAQFRREGYPSYARVLGFRRDAAPLLRKIKENSQLPLITKAAKASSQLEGTSALIWEQEIYASHLYHALVFQKHGISLPNEYSRPLVIL